jgi:hypothetical protein
MVNIWKNSRSLGRTSENNGTYRRNSEWDVWGLAFLHASKQFVKVRRQRILVSIQKGNGWEE